MSQVPSFSHQRPPPRQPSTSYRRATVNASAERARLNTNAETSFGPNGRPLVQGIELVSIHQLPDRFKTLFPYPLFNAVQSKCFETVYTTDDNFVLSAPTGSGKTGVLELAVCRLTLTQPQQSFKVIYQAPTKSLCAERYRDWQTKFGRLGLSCAELTGDTEQSQLRLVGSADVLITTPEKWDSITRKWRDHQRLVDLVKLFLIDEVQILKEDRGASLEAVVSRMKSVGNNDVRFIALSATVPNATDIAKWLGRSAKMRNVPAKVEVFDESFRPVKLDKYVHGLPANGANDFAFEKTCSNKLIEIIIKYCTRMKPILIFCFTRKSTEVTAQLLADWWQKSLPNQRYWTAPESSVAIDASDRNLQQCMSSGVAYHHAGVQPSNRACIENAYLQGKINVICCTSTLAVGINLPCHCVIVKNTVCYQGTDGCKEYSDLEIMQMLGRAGRPQFGKSAIAVIVTRQDKVPRYERMVTGQEIIESRLHLNLINHLNAEIALGTIFDTLSAKVWLRSTFFYVRYRQNPNHYRLRTSEGAATANNIDDIIKQVSDRDIGLLREHLLITSPSDSDSFKSTEYGESMARYHIQFETMKVLLGLPVKPRMSDILTAISQASEFKSIRFRAGEKQIFKQINVAGSIKSPIKVDLALPAHKVSLMIQATLGGVDISKDETFTGSRQQYQIDAALIFKYVHRLVRCVIDCQLHDEDAIGARNALELARSIGAKAWDDSSLQMIQIEKIGPVAVRKLVSAGIRTIEELEELDSQRIDMVLSKNPPFGASILAKLKNFPKLRVGLRTVGQPAVRTSEGTKVIRVNIKAELGFLNDSLPAFFMKKAVHVCLLAETSDGRKVHFCRISAPKLGHSQDVTFSADIVNPDQTVTCYVSCDDIAGTLKYATLEPKIPLCLFSRIGGLEIEPQPLPKARESGHSSEQKNRCIEKPTNNDTDITMDGLDDADLEVAATLAEAANDFETWDREVDFVDIDSLSNGNDDSRGVEKGGTLAGPGRPRSSLAGVISEQQQRTGSQDMQSLHIEEQAWVPKKLPNGNWECNHKCKDKINCKHRCCQEGVDKPPSRPKNSKVNKNTDEGDSQNSSRVQGSNAGVAVDRTVSEHWSVPKVQPAQRPFTTAAKQTQFTRGANIENRSSSLDNLTDLTEPSEPVQGKSIESNQRGHGPSAHGKNLIVRSQNQVENQLNPFKFKVPELDLSGASDRQSKVASPAASNMTTSETKSRLQVSAIQEFKAALEGFRHVEPDEYDSRGGTSVEDFIDSSHPNERTQEYGCSEDEDILKSTEENGRPKKRARIEVEGTPEESSRPAFKQVPGLDEGVKIPSSSSIELENSIMDEIVSLNEFLRGSNDQSGFLPSNPGYEGAQVTSLPSLRSKVPELRSPSSIKKQPLKSMDSDWPQSAKKAKEAPKVKEPALAPVAGAFKRLDSLMSKAGNSDKTKATLDAWFEEEFGDFVEFV